MEKQGQVNVQKSPVESESETSSGISMAPPEFSLTTGVAQAKMMAPVQRQANNTDPITDAVAAIKASSSNTGANYLSERLVRGIVEAEAMFLKENPLNRWAEGLGFADTIGAGQLGEPAIVDVDNQFGAAITEFAKTHGAAPADWKGKATHAQWQYFYTAAYLARSIQEAERLFQPSSPVLTNNQIGIVDIGIAIYHGAFSTIRNLRRRVASENGIKNHEVTSDMVSEEMRSGTANHKEMELEEYTQLAKGFFDFNFSINASLISRRFQIAGGKAKVTCKATYKDPQAIDANRTQTYRIRLEKFEYVSGPLGAGGEGTNWYDWRTYTVGSNQSAEWTDLPRGDYRFKAEKIEDEYSEDVLEGTGKVETQY